MTHEFKKILEVYIKSKQAGLKAVLATVVAVDGSSYRGAGVRMLVLEGNQTVGAISGGCVEKEVVHQTQTVFATGTAKIMTYDGRFRLGCEGTLYVLLEPFALQQENILQLQKSIQQRKTFEISSYYSLTLKSIGMGSVLKLENGICFSFSNNSFNGNIPIDFYSEKPNRSVFKQSVPPCFQLILIGVEHDAKSLCVMASHMGWEVTIIGGPNSQKEAIDFPGHTIFLRTTAEELVIDSMDAQTAVVLMNHNFAKDLLFLKALKECKAIYIGLLGATKRKEQLLSAFIEYHMDVELEFLDKIYGPAGLDIGSETPEEIAVSIISEILVITRKRNAFHLQERKGALHDRAPTIPIEKNEK
jgi:xanthine/CO dehydrogenase XdhC/CoxF family maturation factor